MNFESNETETGPDHSKLEHIYQETLIKLLPATQQQPTEQGTHHNSLTYLSIWICYYFVYCLCLRTRRDFNDFIYFLDCVVPDDFLHVH